MSSRGRSDKRFPQLIIVQREREREVHGVFLKIYFLNPFGWFMKLQQPAVTFHLQVLIFSPSCCRTDGFCACDTSFYTPVKVLQIDWHKSAPKVEYFQRFTLIKNQLRIPHKAQLCLTILLVLNIHINQQSKEVLFSYNVPFLLSIVSFRGWPESIINGSTTLSHR